MRQRYVESCSNYCSLRLTEDFIVRVRGLRSGDGALHRIFLRKTASALVGCRRRMLPLCSLPVTLASIRTISHVKARAAQCLSRPFCTGESLLRRFWSRARSRIRRKGKGGKRAVMEGTELGWLVACIG